MNKRLRKYEIYLSIKVSKSPQRSQSSRLIFAFFFQINCTCVAWQLAAHLLATLGAFEKGSIFRARVGRAPYALNIFRSIDETMKVFAVA